MERRRCRATAQRSGQRCQKPPIVGGVVCATHGGAAPAVRAAARRRLVTSQAAAALVKFDLPEVDDPILALGQLAAETRAVLTSLGLRVNDQDPFGDGDVSAVLAAYERTTSRLARILADLGRLGYEARRVQISEAIADQVADVVNGILADLQLDPEQESRAPAVVARHMIRLAESA